MKKFLLCSLSVLLIFTGISQIRAVTSTGDEVILNANGTWQYVNKDLQNLNKVDTNKTIFGKPSNASFLVKSNKVNYGVYIDPQKWTFKKGEHGDASEFVFDLKEEDAYAMFISEKLEIPLETLKGIALENAKEVGPDIKIVKEDYRRVNRKLILFLQMEGSIQGIKVTYSGYYYSSPSGTLQLVTYTTSNLFDEYKAVLEDFLNGFVTLDK
jgi:hypothetical protein